MAAGANWPSKGQALSSVGIMDEEMFALNPVVVVIQQDHNSISGYIIR